MKYLLSIHGCDDSTEFNIELTDKELELVEKICELSKETSTYGCMPIMMVVPIK